MQLTLEAELAALVKQFRQQHGVTQEELAYRSDVSVDTIRKLESGAHLIRIDTLFKLAQGFGIEPSAFCDPLWLCWKKQVTD